MSIPRPRSCADRGARRLIRLPCPRTSCRTQPGHSRRNSTSDVKMRFQVIRFHPADGVTVPRPFEAGPGEIIGEPKTADIPVSDGTGKKSKTIDFNSHQIVLDIFANKKTGGYQPLPAGFVGPPDRQAVARLAPAPDGSVGAPQRGRRRGQRCPQGYRRQLQARDQAIEQEARKRHRHGRNGHDGRHDGCWRNGRRNDGRRPSVTSNHFARERDCSPH